MMKPLHLALTLCAFSLSCSGQSSFQNLGFEDAHLVWPNPGDHWTVSASDALPGWYGVSQYLGYDTVALDSAKVSLHDHQSPYAPVIFGDYSLLFQRSSDGTKTPRIFQTGQVPEVSLSLRFTSRAYFYNNYFNVTFNGTELPVQFISTSSDGTLWGADISGIAGQTGELKFQGVGVLDGIEFSPIAVPEPGIWSLVLLGGGVMVANLRGPHSRQR